MVSKCIFKGDSFRLYLLFDLKMYMKNIVFILIFRKWEDDLVKDMVEWLVSDFFLSFGLLGGMIEYRRILCISFFYKFYFIVLM